MIRLRSAVCVLGRFPALAGVDLDVDSGERLLLSGPNGAGKTTLLRLLAGLVALHSGEASVLGVDLARDRRTARRALALVGPDTGCYDDLTVRENLRFWVSAAGRPMSGADRALEQMGLERVADVAHRELSTGQRRRLGLAVALARDPRLLLLDEPHAGLDEEGRRALDSLLDAAAGEDRTVLIASHEVAHVRARATRELVLVAGQGCAVLHDGASAPSAPASPVVGGVAR